MMLKFLNSRHIAINRKNIFFWLSFLLPALIFLSYFFYSKNGVLTVDLGQQYVDFLAFFRRNLFSHPLRLIYSFSNGLGGSMLATDAYYLCSPFNLLLFLFPQHFLPQAILIIIALKIGAAGLSSYYYWKQKITNHFYALAASSAYALSGYVIGNHYNLMWLDSVILLPLLINAIDRLLAQRKNKLILITFLLWFTNFYTGFMALAFGLLYLLSKIFFINKQERLRLNWIYLRKSIAGSFLDAFMLFPVLIEMLQGKASSTASWNLGWQFSPVEQLTKLAEGAYNFHEMKEGMPNIYLTMPFLLLTILYFLSKKINWQRKLANGILLIFLIASLFWTPLVLLWHLGQFPVWYPGRFSFVLIFFALNLGVIALEQKERIAYWQTGLLTLFSLGLIVYIVFNASHFDFLTEDAQIATGAFLALGILFIGFIYHQHSFAAPFFYLVIELELIVNLVLSLGNLAYQKNSDYQNFTTNVSQAVQYANQHDSGFYRTEKTFYRSDDDPFSAGYYGLSNFNSISDQKVLNLINNLGFLNNSNSYTNFGGTTLTDDLLGIKYYLLPNDEITTIKSGKQMKYDNSNHRVDASDYHLQKRFSQLYLVKNNAALPLLFLTSQKTQKINFNSLDITSNQTKFFQAVTGAKVQLFKQINWPKAKLINVTSMKNDQLQYNRKNNKQIARIIFNFKPQTDDSYYIEMPGEIDDNAISMTVNGANINLAVRDQNARLINLGSHQRGQRLQVTFELKKDKLDLSGIHFWRLNTQKLEQIIHRFKQKQPNFKQTSALIIKSNHFTTKKMMTLASTIPNNINWLVLDNGKIINKNKTLFMNAFLNFKLNPGKHQITLIYVPWVLLLGMLVSLISLTILLICKKKATVSANSKTFTRPTV